MDAAAGPLVHARHALDRGRPERALELLAGISGPDLDHATFWRLRARALYQLRRWSDAGDAAREGLVREPHDLQLLDVLALSQLEQRRRKDARATIDAALALYPNVAVLHAHRALILARSASKGFRLTSYRGARSAVERALRLDPDCESAIRVRAQIAALSRDKRAPEYGAEVLAREPDDGVAHALAGATLARRGDVSAALEHYVEAARLDPSNESLVWLGRRGRALQRPFAAPLRLMQRATRGNLRFAWAVVALASFHAHLPWLTAAVFGVWAYLWGVHLYLRRRVGKAPK